MAELDARGNIAIAFSVLYAILFFAILSRSWFLKKFTWDNVLFFVLFRIISGALFAAYELESASPRSALFVAASVFQSIGLPVLLSCLAFFCSELPQLLFLIGYSIDNTILNIDLILNIINAANTAGLILVIISDVMLTNSHPSVQGHADKYFKIASLLFAATYAALAMVYFVIWSCAPAMFDLPSSANTQVVSASERHMVMKILRNCITVMLFAFPVLAVRVVYEVLSAFAPAPIFSNTGIISSNPSAPLAKFSFFTGNWKTFLVMSVIMELLVVFFYIIARLTLPRTIQFFQTDTYPPAFSGKRNTKRHNGTA